VVEFFLKIMLILHAIPVQAVSLYRLLLWVW